MLPTLHKTPPNGTIGGVFVCGGKIPEPWAARVCGPNRDKEVLASMADGTKTDAAPEAPGGPPAPEQTEQAGIPGMDGGPAPSGKGKRTARRCWPRSGLP